jgi:hypothetical protein
LNQRRLGLENVERGALAGLDLLAHAVQGDPGPSPARNTCALVATSPSQQVLRSPIACNSRQLAVLSADLVQIAGHLLSSPHSQMNMRTVSPFLGLSILPMRRGLLPHFWQLGGSSSSFIVKKLMMPRCPTLRYR